MRSDMAKVIVERERRGGYKRGQPHKGYRRKLGRGLEDLPQKEGIRRPYGWDRKELNENLNPLRRYLAKQVGRPWDKVYSEISATLDARNAVLQHVRDHLMDFVALREVYYVGDVLMQRNTWGPDKPLRDATYPDLFVDPRTGILRTIASLQRKQTKRVAAVRVQADPPKALDEWRKTYGRILNDLLAEHRLRCRPYLRGGRCSYCVRTERDVQKHNEATA